MNVKHLTHLMVGAAVQGMRRRIEHDIRGSRINAYAVPRGGVPVLYLLMAHGIPGLGVVENPKEADIFIDDLIDSGRTRERYAAEYPGRLFYAAFNKNEMEGRPWLVFPWEKTEEKSIEDAVVRLLQYVGEDSTRGGLEETPGRVAKAWKSWCSGYGQDPVGVLKCFEDGAEGVDEMVVVKDIPFYSHCEHHLAPFFGTASIAYIPNGRVVGLSKLSRVLDIFARRLQVQERLTNQVADTLFKVLDARGVGVILTARHMCMESRGVCKQGHHTVTAALRGAMKDQPETRAEFMALVNK